MSRGSLLPLLLLALFALSPKTAHAQQATVAWRTDLTAARQEAAQSGRNLILHFWAPWCGPCRRLESTVFNQPAVASTLGNSLVPVKLNADQSRQIAETYGIDRLPTDVILSPDGRVLGKFTSPQDPSAYLAAITRFASPQQRASAIARQQPGAPNSQQRSGSAPPPIHPAYAQLSAAEQAAMDAHLQSRHTGAPAIESGRDYRSLATGHPASEDAPSVPIQRPATPGYGSNSPAIAAAGDDYGSRYAPNPSWEQSHGGGQATPSAPSAPPAAGAPATVSRFAQQYASAQGYSRMGSGGNIPGNRQAAPQVHSPSSTQGLPSRSSSGHDRTAAAGAPSGRMPLGLDGYCPVTLKQEQRWVLGDKRFGVVHRGRLYLFSGPGQQQQFWADPDRYSPVLSGIDPVLALDNGASVSGLREHGVEYNGLTYLFSSESTLQHFSENPERYASGVRQAMQVTGGTATRY